MNGLLADADIRGHFEALISICRSADWGEFWADLGVPVFAFEDVGLPANASDIDVWEVCQHRGLVLVTGNRNAEGETSLEATIRARGTIASLPVFTLANRDRILSDRNYAEQVAARLMELLTDINSLRGTGRLWLP